MPIAACRLSADDLKRLYRLINEKQVELGKRLVAGLYATPQESAEQFKSRTATVQNAFITTVTVTGKNGEVVSGHGEAFFDSPLLPERIQAIAYDTGFTPNAVLKYTPLDRASVLLDFSRPALIDISASPSNPTPNNSNWFITAETESWSTSLGSRLGEFFRERATKLNWMHGPAVYDSLLLVLGLPLSIWAAYRLGHLVSARLRPPTVINTAVYLYAFFFALNVFRGLFSYAKWIFPKVELQSENSGAATHRFLWSAIVLGVLGSAVWDAIKSLFD